MNNNIDSELRSSRDDIQLVSSFINLERRRLKTGCYDDCLDALNAISFRIEILSFLDNFLFSKNYKDRVPADVFLNSVLKFLMDQYSPRERDYKINVSGTLDMKQCRNLSLILNELMVSSARTRTPDHFARATVNISQDSEVIRIRLNLVPTPPYDKDINMLVILDLLEQHGGDISPQSANGMHGWYITFPVSGHS